MNLTNDVDMDIVQRLALAGSGRMAEADPAIARRVRDAIERDGGASLHVALWEDGEAAIAVIGYEVWRGPVTEILVRPAA